MQAIARKLYTEEEYWALEEAAPFKNEFWDGEIVAMSGGTFNHGRIAASVIRRLGNKLAGKPCVVVGSDVRVKVEKSRNRFNTYPDVSIACPPFRFEEKRSGIKDTLLNPRVLIEVLSPSTEKFDRTAKFDEYKLIESLTDYLLIEQEQIRVEHYHRAENGLWTVQSYTAPDDSFALIELEITLSLAEIYEGVEVSEALRLLPEAPDED